MDGWIERKIYMKKRRMVGWMDKKIDGWLDGWLDGQKNI